MLATLIRLGSQLSQNRGEWDDIIDYPNIENETRKNIHTCIGEIVFDLDQQRVYLNEDLRGYDKTKSCIEHKYIKIQGGNNKAIYACVESGKLEQIRKTFFGVTDAKGKEPSCGQFQEVIQKDYPIYKESLLYKLLPGIFTLKEEFEQIATCVKEVKGKEIRVIDEKFLLSTVDSLGPNARVVLFYTSVISSKDGIGQPTPITRIDGFQEFMRAKFLNKESKTSTNTKKLSYASGLEKADVTGADFPNRYSLNYMFVETTLNYASGFDKTNFQKNYQIGREEQLLLERGSKYVLDSLKIKIAGIDHCVIPSFLHSAGIDIEYITKEIVPRNELLFAASSLEDLADGGANETDQPFWLTYLGFESDGNFFKTIHEIRDVSKFHLNTVIDTFHSVHRLFTDELSFVVDWPGVLREYNQQRRFNLNTIYGIIPIRKEKEKKNEALFLFKCLLEKRIIDPLRLFKSFCDLMLCHRFGRYKSYTNIREYDEEYFNFAIRDAIYKYLGVIQVFKQLNLLNNMEENETFEPSSSEGDANEISRKTYAFLDKMGYTPDQRALFFLGRMLNTVTFLQNGKVKTALDKVNFNGMSPGSIIRLRNSLIEKAKQYNGVSKVIFNDAEFSKHFNYGHRVNPQEAVFFILSGYSFGITLSKDNNKQTPNN